MNATNDRNKKITKKDVLPRPRTNLSDFLAYLVGSSLIFLSTLTADRESVETWINVAAVSTSVLINLIFVVEMLSRCLLCFEECKHLQTRYNNRRLTILKDMIYFTPSLVIILVCAVSVGCYIFSKYNEWPPVLWYNFGSKSVFTSIVGIFILTRVLKLNSGPLYDSLWIENSNGLDYGSGMAHSFFHGYLKLIIPKTGTSEKHLEELMEDYEAKHGVKLEFYKLFILIPKSLYCPISLMNKEYSPTIEESSSLAEKQMTVAGVQNRSYKNSVYKIRSDKAAKPTYVCAEYATPLKTFKDVCQYNGEHSNYYDKHKNDIVLQFYLTLKKVLKEHDNCTDFCELIFYDDKDENGRYKDVGEILLQRHKRLRKQMKNLQSRN